MFTCKIHPAPWNEDANQQHRHRVFECFLGAILNPMDHEQGQESGVHSGQYEWDGQEPAGAIDRLDGASRGNSSTLMPWRKASRSTSDL